MEISLKFHGILRDRVRHSGKETSTLALSDTASINELRECLATFGLDDRFSIAVNGVMVNEADYLLEDGDRVDVFRQAAGG
jgi:molybdopterin converting factor small subunit